MAKKKSSKRRPAAKTRKRTPGKGSKARSKARPARKVRAKKTSRRKAARPRATKRTRGLVASSETSWSTGRGMGAEAGGQSGDIEGLSRSEVADSESVEELVEEGQAFEAGIVEGVENAPDADEGPIRTREVPEDDVPEEYLDED